MAEHRPLVLSDGVVKQIPSGDTLPSGLGLAQSLIPTTSRSTSHTALAGEYVMADASSGPITVTLPATGSAGVKKTDTSANLVTVAVSSGKTLGTLGAASIPLRLADQAMITQVNGSNHVITHGYQSLAALDNRYRKTACFDDFTTKPDGTLAGTTSDSGHLWSTSVMLGSGSQHPAIYGGAMGSPGGFTPGGAGPTAGGYAYLQPGGVVSWVGTEIVWDPSDATGSGLNIGAFTQIGVSATSGGASMHLAVLPYGCEFAVFDVGTNAFTRLVPDGYDVTYPRFPVAMACDGTTTYRIEVAIDRARSRAYATIGDFPTLTWTHPWIGSVPATYAVWQYYSVTGGTNLPRFRRVWADAASAAAVPPQAPQLATMAAGAGPGRGGSGPGVSRPYSRMRPGAAWADGPISTALSAATAAAATSFQAPIPLPVGTVVTIDSTVKQEVRTVTARSGSGPYAHSVSALIAAHSSGAPVVTAPKASFSDGSYWRDAAGSIIGNRIPHNVATAAEDGSGLSNSPAGNQITRVRAPIAAWATNSAYKLTCSTAGSVGAFHQAVAVEVGSPVFGGIAQALAGVTPRNAVVRVRFYDGAAAQVGSDVTSATVTVPTGPNPVNTLLTPVTVVPSGATVAIMSFTFSSVAVGETFFVADLCLAVGAVPTHLRT